MAGWVSNKKSKDGMFVYAFTWEAMKVQAKRQDIAKIFEEAQSKGNDFAYWMKPGVLIMWALKQVELSFPKKQLIEFAELHNFPLPGTAEEMACTVEGHGELVLRTNRTTGDQFYGCSKFPRCDETIDFDNALRKVSNITALEWYGKLGGKYPLPSQRDEVVVVSGIAKERRFSKNEKSRRLDLEIDYASLEEQALARMQADLQEKADKQVIDDLRKAATGRSLSDGGGGGGGGVVQLEYAKFDTETTGLAYSKLKGLPAVSRETAMDLLGRDTAAEILQKQQRVHDDVIRRENDMQATAPPCSDCTDTGWLHMDNRGNDRQNIIGMPFGKHIDKCDSCQRHPGNVQARFVHLRECGCGWGDASSSEKTIWIDYQGPNGELRKILETHGFSGVCDGAGEIEVEVRPDRAEVFNRVIYAYYHTLEKTWPKWPEKIDSDSIKETIAMANLTKKPAPITTGVPKNFSAPQPPPAFSKEMKNNGAVHYKLPRLVVIPVNAPTCFGSEYESDATPCDGRSSCSLTSRCAVESESHFQNLAQQALKYEQWKKENAVPLPLNPTHAKAQPTLPEAASAAFRFLAGDVNMMLQNDRIDAKLQRKFNEIVGDLKNALRLVTGAGGKDK